MDSLWQACPFPCTPTPRKEGEGTTKEDKLSGYILILQDDCCKVTFLNCLTGGTSEVPFQLWPGEFDPGTRSPVHWTYSRVNSSRVTFFGAWESNTGVEVGV
jgi:hypothetical protein